MNKLLLGTIALLGVSSTVYGKLYPKDGIPQGDCLEMRCPSGTCMEDGNLKGSCCPVDLPGAGEACTECGCAAGFICDDATQQCRAEIKECAVACNVCQTCDKTQGKCVIDTAQNGMNKQPDGKCCVNGALAYDAALCPDRTGQCTVDGVTYNDGADVADCGKCSKGSISNLTIQLDDCHECNADTKWKKSVKISVQDKICGTKCCADGCNEAGNDCKGVCHGVRLLEIKRSPHASETSARGFTGNEKCCPVDKFFTNVYQGSQDLKTTENASQGRGTRYTRDYFVADSGYKLNANGAFTQFSDFVGCCDRSGYTRVKAVGSTYACARDTHLMKVQNPHNSYNNGQWQWVVCPMHPCSRSPNNCGGHSDPGWFYAETTHWYGPVKEPKE